MTQPETLTGAVTALSVGVNAQIEAIRGLQVSIHEEALARDRKVRTLQRVLVAVLAALVLLVIVVVTNLYTLKVQNDAAVDRSNAATIQRQQQKSILDAIQSCTQPGGSCFSSNREDTAKALLNLQKFELVTEYCQTVTPSGDGAGYLTCIKKYAPPLAPTTIGNN